MKRATLLLSLLLLLLPAGIPAQTFTEWQDPQVNAVNRLPMHSTFLPKEARIIPLAGDWSFNWVRNANQRPTDFWLTDYVETGWGKMKLPGMWELNGRGAPVYVNIGYA